MLWSGHGTLRRRQECPSWSWMGWDGEIEMSPTHDTDYDQMWLLQGTWIVWQRTNYKRKLDLLWGLDDTSQMALERIERIKQSVSQYEKTRAKEPDADDNNMQTHSDLDSNSSENDRAHEEPEWREWSPAYGESTPMNPYGRTPEQNEAKQTVGSVEFSPIRSIICDEEDLGWRMLCFSAPVISLSAGPTVLEANDYSRSTLYDRERRTCGYLSVHDSQSWSNKTQERTVKLLLLSVMPFGALESHKERVLAICDAFGAGDDMIKYLEGWPRSLDNFEFLNVMFVLETSDKAEIELEDGSSHNVPIHERAGIGFVYGKALSDIKREHIVLA